MQKYSEIARKYLQDKDEKEPGIVHCTVAWGNTQDMEELFILFDGDRKKVYERTKCIGHHFRFKFVMDRLDRESKKNDAIFNKYYLNYPGIINRPTRCFVLKEGDKRNERKPYI